LRVQRSAAAPIRAGLTVEARWLGPDTGVIAAWERGRAIAKEPGREELVAAVRAGQLPILPWKGGVERAIKAKQKFGTMRYLAMWQGLRGDDLDVDLSRHVQVTCAATGVTVTFTNDVAEYAGQDAE
jgi:hypothetical protein